MKKNSGNPNLPIKTGGYLPNIEQTKQVIQQANVNDKALSNILNSRDPEFWLGKAREALDRAAWMEAAYYGLKALFFDADYYKADIVLAYTFGRLRDIDKSLFYMEKVDRFGKVADEVYRSLLSREELYFLSVVYEIINKIQCRKKVLKISNLLKEIAQPAIYEGFEITPKVLNRAYNQNINYMSLYAYDGIEIPKEISVLQNLIKLDIGGNILFYYEDDIDVLKSLMGLVYLNLNNLHLDFLPSGIKELKELSYLNLEENDITNLNVDVNQFKSLLFLNLENNQIKTFSFSGDNSYKLIFLNLNNNNLKSFLF